MTLKRTDIPWRELPPLRIEEAAEIAGVSRRTVANAIEQNFLEVRRLGHVPVIATAEFHRWIGEDLADVDPHSDLSVVRAAHAKARRLLGKVG
jgi:excisionase family DNA binding protein